MYTMRLSRLIELRGGKCRIEGGLRVLDKPEILHLDSYPIYLEAHRAKLNSFILDTYWNREIAHESADIFIQKIRSHMHMVMPTYNKLYESAALEIDPLRTMDMLATSTGTSESESRRESTADSTSTQNATSRSVSSDTPQVQLAGDGHYASNAVDALSGSTTGGTATDEATASDQAETSNEARTVGYSGSAASLIREYQDSVLNVDQMVVDDLNQFFLPLWGSPHTFTFTFPTDWI